MLFATDGTMPESHRRLAGSEFPVRCVACASGFLVLALGLFLCARRAIGAASASPRLELVVLTGLILVAWAWLVRLAFWRRSAANHQSLAAELRSPDSAVAVWIPLAAWALFAIACSYPFARIAGCVFWSVALTAVLWGPRLPRSARSSLPAIGGEISAENLLQKSTRYRLADGREAVHGTLTAHFAAGERGTTLYVGFCPPFERLPHVEASAIDGPPATVKLAQVLHQGAQVELRLIRIADRQQRVNVRFSAVELAAAEPASPSEL